MAMRQVHLEQGAHVSGKKTCTVRLETSRPVVFPVHVWVCYWDLWQGTCGVQLAGCLMCSRAHSQVCGGEGHNRRTCPLVIGEAPPREKRAKAPLYPRPENAPVYRGVTWAAMNGQWRAQVWDGQRVSCQHASQGLGW